MNLQHTQASPLFQDFRAIHPANYRSLVRFYERNEANIEELSTEEQFVIWCYYANALHGLGGGAKHLELVDKILEYSIIHNFQYVDGVDIYSFFLYQKAVSLLRRSEWDKAVRIATQLLRINPDEPQHIRLLRRCLLAKRPLWVKYMMGVAVSMFLVCAVCTVGQIFVVEAFYPQIQNAIWWAQILSFGTAVNMAAAAGLGHQFYAKRRAQSIWETAIHCRE